VFPTAGAPRCAWARYSSVIAGRDAGSGLWPSVYAALRPDNLAHAQLGARGYAPHNSASRLASFSWLGPRASDGSPRRAANWLGSQCARADCVQPRTCPNPLCGLAPLRLRLAVYDCAPPACMSRAPRIGRGLRPRQRLRRHGGAAAVIPDCSAQPKATLRQPARPARPSALRAYSPGPLWGCGFRA